MEYKFRGKSKRTNEWVYGSSHYCNQKGIIRSRKWGTVMDIIDEEVQFDKHWILVHQTPCSLGWDIRDSFVPHEVYPESVGLHFGWVDSDENEIYTGDHLEIFWTDDESTCETISYSQEHGYFMYGNNPVCELVENKVKSKVVGNIHDVNPASGQAGVNHMFDPNLKAEQEKSVAESESAAANAQESASQDKAMEVQDSEEGSTEG